MILVLFCGLLESCPAYLSPNSSRLEIRHTAVDNLYTIFKSDTVLPLEELILEGDLLDDYSLRYIVNGLTLQEIQEDFLK